MQLEETIAERGKLMPQKKETGIKVLTPKKLTRLPILLARRKAGNNSNKLEKVRQIVLRSHQRNEIMKILYKNLIKSLQ